MIYFFAIWYSRFHYTYRHWMSKSVFRPYVVTSTLFIVGGISPIFLKATQIEIPTIVSTTWVIVFVIPSWVLLYPTLIVIKELLGDWNEDRARILKNIRKSDLLN